MRTFANGRREQRPGIRRSRPNQGPFASEDEALAQVVHRLAGELDPEAIWLFGSRAENRSAPDSDFDLLVVTKVADGDKGFEYGAAYAPIEGWGVGCDVIPVRADDFAEDVADPTSFCFHVVKTGRKLYERGAARQGILHPG